MIEPLVYDRLVTALGASTNSCGDYNDDFNDDFDNGDCCASYNSDFSDDFDITDCQQFTRVYPVIPTEGTALPYAVYKVSGGPVWTLAGPTDTMTYSVVVDLYGVDLDTVEALATEVHSHFNGWSSPTIKVSALESAGSEAQPHSYLGRLTYRILAKV